MVQPQCSRGGMQHEQSQTKIYTHIYTHKHTHRHTHLRANIPHSNAAHKHTPYEHPLTNTIQAHMITSLDFGR